MIMTTSTNGPGQTAHFYMLQAFAMILGRVAKPSARYFRQRPHEAGGMKGEKPTRGASPLTR